MAMSVKIHALPASPNVLLNSARNRHSPPTYPAQPIVDEMTFEALEISRGLKQLNKNAPQISTASDAPTAIQLYSPANGAPFPANRYAVTAGNSASTTLTARVATDSAPLVIRINSHDPIHAVTSTKQAHAQ